MKKESKIYIAGHNGLVGSAIERKLRSLGYKNLLLKNRNDLDLINQNTVKDFFMDEKPEYVFLCAAKVGGILANINYPAEFIYNNLMIGLNIVNSAYLCGVKKLINLGSSCIYPKQSKQPIIEESLLESSLEPTNEAYAIAKIAIVKLCAYYNKQYGTNFISVMPTNQYGINDNFNMETAHLLPMILRRFHLAKLLQHNRFDCILQDVSKYKLGHNLDEIININNIEEIMHKIGVYKDKVVMWGSGNVYRELMNSDDLSDACIFLMNNVNYDDIGDIINITSGTDILLKDLIFLVKEIVGFNGTIEFDSNKPDGIFRKLMDDTKIKSLGWQPQKTLKDGIQELYNWYCKPSQQQTTRFLEDLNDSTFIQ